MIVMLPFSILRGAVFTEPSVTKIEKVIGLVHGTALPRFLCKEELS